MTKRKEEEEYIEILQAYLDGKKIECLPIHEKKWVEVEHPVWDFHIIKYRVKPPKKLYKVPVPYNEDSAYYFNNYETAKNYAEELMQEIETYVLQDNDET